MGYFIMGWQRAAHKMHKKGMRILPKMIYFAQRVICGCSIPPSVEIGKGTKLAHNGLGVVIHDKTVIGEDTIIQANVVLGGRSGQIGPTVGNYCYIGAGACVLGDIKIGDDAQIGANAVVLHDVAPGTVVAGVPAKYIKNVDGDMIGKIKRYEYVERRG